MNKIIYGILIAAILFLGGKNIYDNYRFNNLRQQHIEQLQQANLELGKAQTLVGTASKYIDELENKLKKEIEKNNELITRYGELEAEYNALADSVGDAEIIYIEGPAIEVPAELKLTQGLLYEAITNSSLMATQDISRTMNDNRLKISCSVRPYPNNNRDIPIIIGYELRLKIGAQLVETKTSLGSTNFYINIFELDDKGNKIGKFKLTKFDYVVDDQTSPSFKYWAPHLNLGLFAGVDSNLSAVNGGVIDITLMGFGNTKNDLTWKFIGLGVQLSSNDIRFAVSPFQWNVGSVVPLISNVWLSPYVNFGSEYIHSIGGQLTVGM